MSLQVTADHRGVRFPVKVVPGSARDRIAGLLGVALKVQVTAPPEKGRANERLCELLAAALGVPVSSVQVQSGLGSPRKVVSVAGLDAADLLGRLDLLP